MAVAVRSVVARIYRALVADAAIVTTTLHLRYHHRVAAAHVIIIDRIGTQMARFATF